MTEAVKNNITGMINFGYFSEASDMLTEYSQANPDNAEIIPLVSMLKKRISALNTALDEQIDLRFFELMERIAARSEDEIFEMILNSYNSLSQGNISRMAQYITNHSSFYGRLAPETGDYESFRIRARSIKNHYNDIIWLHKRLGDARSKNTLFSMLSNWVDMDFVSLDRYKELALPEYFDPFIFPRRCDEVFVDLGAANGDSVYQFINAHLGKYKHIYCYEITPLTFEWLQNNLANKQNITMRQKGAWSSPGTLRLTEGFEPGSNHISDTGEIIVDTVRIDDDITEPITFLKMDIEGAEVEALRGCKRQIRENRPRLAICVYHSFEHVYAIPRLVDEIAPGYKFFMRHHSGNLFPTEFTLLAV